MSRRGRDDLPDTMTRRHFCPKRIAVTRVNPSGVPRDNTYVADKSDGGEEEEEGRIGN